MHGALNYPELLQLFNSSPAFLELTVCYGPHYYGAHSDLWARYWCTQCLLRARQSAIYNSPDAHSRYRKAIIAAVNQDPDMEQAVRIVAHTAYDPSGLSLDTMARIVNAAGLVLD